MAGFSYIDNGKFGDMGKTAQRREVLEAVMQSDEHLTVEQIYERVRQRRGNVGKGTVYRNLNLLADDGEIRRVHIPNEPIRFDRIVSPHQHALCVKCGRLFDIPDIDAATAQRLVGSKSRVIDRKLLVDIICEGCQGDFRALR
jgi:Fe2+ or Zn2+ uptake regulation protein